MISLKNIKVVKALSEETTCFTASVWFGNKKIGTASNRGHGGSTDVNTFGADSRALEAEAEAWAKANPIKFFSTDMGCEVCIQSLEEYVDHLVDVDSYSKDLKALLKKHVVISTQGGQLYQMRLMPGKTVADVKPHEEEGLRKRYPDMVVMLNKLPFDEALAIYGKGRIS